MTKAEVLIILISQMDSNLYADQILSWTSRTRVRIRPTETDKNYKGSTTTSPVESVPGILPLGETLDKVDLDESLASVLGRERAIVPCESL